MISTVTFLLERGASVNGSERAKIKNVKNDYVEREDSDCEESEEDEDENQGKLISPLYCALEAGHFNVAKLLIERGAETSNSDRECNSLAELAAKYCKRDVLQLPSNKIIFDFDKLVNGEILLTSATSRKDFDSVLRLLQMGVNVNARNMSGDTALSGLLQFVDYSDVVEVAKLLLKFGADINIMNDRSQTPLQIACFRNFNKVAELFLELGCETNVKNGASFSPLHYAAYNNNGKLVEMLLQYGANAKVKTGQDKITPLLEAVKSNSIHAAQVLLEHGAKLEVENALGRRPLAEAAACSSLNREAMFTQRTNWARLLLCLPWKVCAMVT